MLLKFVKKSLRAIRGIIATAVMVGVTPTHLILHVGSQVICLVLPRKFSYTADDFMWGFYQKLILFFFEHMTGVEIIFSGEIPKEKENVILICNHQCTVDWVVTDMIAMRQGMIGQLRFVFKDAIKYLPLYNYAFGMHSGVFVKRDGTYSGMNMRKILDKLNKNQVLSWFVVFPEGTRFSTKQKQLLAKSQAYAIANNLKPLNQVLTPRIKAFHCALNGFNKHADAVYDATIFYEEKSEPLTTGQRDPAPSMWKFLNSPSPRIYIRFDRIPIRDIPADPQEETLAWLHSRFERKDILISHHCGLLEKEETEAYIAGVVTKSGVNGPMPDLSKEALRLGEPSTTSMWQFLPPAIIYTSATAFLLATSTGRMVYFGSLFGGSVATIIFSKLFF